MIEHFFFVTLLCIGVYKASQKGFVLSLFFDFVHSIIFNIVRIIMYTCSISKYFTLNITRKILSCFGVKKPVYYINKKKLEEEIEEFACYAVKPIYTCVVCMSSFWSLIYMYAFNYRLSFFQTIIFVGVVAGFNDVMTRFLEK